jgi:tetratricopeptide (TPR) repeat protein
MRIDQIDYLNQCTDKIILRFNSFIIANQNQEQVLNSLQNSSNTNGLHRVCFEIDINQIGKIYKQFIIFPITTYFKIISIKFDKRIWIVKINVFNFNQFNKNKNKNPIELAHLLRHIGQFHQSEKLFSLLLNQYPSLNAECYNGLGRIAQDKGLYDISLQYYKESLQNISFKDRPHCLNNIGCAYDYLEQYQQALQYYFQALTFMKNDQNQAMCLNNIAITYAKIQQYDKAIEYFKDSLAKRKTSLPENHIDIGISYTNLGVIYSSLGQLDNALQYFDLALKSFQLNKSNIFKAILYQNMAKIFQDKIQFNKALQFYQDALNIFKQFRPEDHPNIIYIQHQIQQLK